MNIEMKQNILIVDDHPENLLVLENILEAPGLNFIRSQSGEEALRIMLKQRDVALILLDVQMPGMDGFETASILRSAPNTKHIPIIFVTAISKEDKNIFKGYESGAVDYMFKPVDPDILKSKVKVFLELDRRKRVLEEKNIELHEAKKNTDKILRNVRNGLFLLDRDLNFKPQYSMSLEKILLTDCLANTNFIEFLDNKIPDKIKVSCKDYLDLIYQNNMPESTLEKLNPMNEIELAFKLGDSEDKINKTLNFSFKRIYNNNQEIDEIIATVEDITEKIILSQKLKDSEDQYKRQMEMAFNILHVEPSLLNEFMEGLQDELKYIDELLEQTEKSSEYCNTLEKIFRSAHLIKGNESLLDLKFFVNQAHEFEDKIIEIAGDLNKKVKLTDDNFNLGDIPYKKRLLVKEILIQLIRNAISHGIEKPANRKKSKKNETGSLILSSFHNETSFGFALRDDGAGIQVDRLKRNAEKTGKIKKQEIDSLDKDQLVNLIFLQGVSTLEQVDQISGRGIGMAIIKEKITKHDGKIDIDFQPNKFCEFTITFKNNN
ncbi:MAG: response regulator [Calditrichaceae bacterium]